jgi:hypothetical protein
MLNEKYTQFAITYFAISSFILLLAFLGVFDPSGFINLSNDGYLIKIDDLKSVNNYALDSFLSIVYISMIFFNVVVLLSYKTKHEFAIKVFKAIKIQLFIYLAIIIVGLLLAFTDLSSSAFSSVTSVFERPVEGNIVGFSTIVIIVLSSLYVMRRNLNDVKNTFLIAAFSSVVALFIGVYTALLNVNISNKFVEIQIPFAKLGTPLEKFKIVGLGVEKYNDGVVTLQRASDNFSNYQNLLISLYSNKENIKLEQAVYAFDEFYKKYKVQAIPEKPKGLKLRMTLENELYQRNKNNDLKLIEAFKSGGLDNMQLVYNQIKLDKKNKQNSFNFFFEDETIKSH